MIAGGGGGGFDNSGGGGGGGFREYKSPVTPYTASPLNGNQVEQKLQYQQLHIP